MATVLPTDFSRDTYWQTVYHQPVAYWQPALESIRAGHQLAAGTWERFSLGRNVVFSCDQLVVKLSPPFWRDEIPRECDALQFIYGRLPVNTPELVATGQFEDWGYLIQRRLPGDLLRSRWLELEPKRQLALAHQQGEIMAALHALPLHNAPASLAFDWSEMIAEQMATCSDEMRQVGVSQALLDDLPAYLAQAQPMLEDNRAPVLLHGDLGEINLLVEARNEQWQISGLVDWGDVKIGPVAHEFISPGIYNYRGARDRLLAWYAGYGLTAQQRTVSFEQEVMVRSMLYYAGDFARLLDVVPGANQQQDWAAVAACFWHFTDRGKDAEGEVHDDWLKSVLNR